MSNSPNSFRNGTVTNLTYATSAGTAVSTAGFGAQTYWISLTAPGAFTTTGGVRYLVDTARSAQPRMGHCSPSTGRKWSKSQPARKFPPSAMTVLVARWLWSNSPPEGQQHERNLRLPPSSILAESRSWRNEVSAGELLRWLRASNDTGAISWIGIELKETGNR